MFSDPHSLRPVRGWQRADPCCDPGTVLFSENSLFSPFLRQPTLRISTHGADPWYYVTGHVPPAQAAPESQVRQQVFPGRKQFL